MEITNPILCEQVGAIRDPMILPYGGRYYMVGTTKEFWEGENPGVKLWRSDNLTDWEFVKLIVNAAEIPSDRDYTDRFWAPELFEYGGRFFCVFNAHNAKKTPLNVGLRSFIAWSDRIDGEYTVCDKPLIEGDFTTNDAHLFADDDGKVYLFYTTGDVILRNEFDPYTFKVSPTAHTVIRKGELGEWDSAGIEGSFVIKRGGLYYHWYSSWTRGYEMGLAVTDSLEHPFRKLDINPVITGFEKDCRLNYCGHNSCFVLPDGGDAIAFHAAGEGFNESLCINRVKYPVTEINVPDLTVTI